MKKALQQKLNVSLPSELEKKIMPKTKWRWEYVTASLTTLCLVMYFHYQQPQVNSSAAKEDDAIMREFIQDLEQDERDIEEEFATYL